MAPLAVVLWSPMRRASRIVTPLLAAAAVSILTGCRPKEMQRCVDDKGNVVADNLCAGQPPQVVQQQPDGHGGFHPIYIPMYRYYYGGGGGYGLGSRAFGGGFVPQAGRSYSRGGFFGGSVTRGGFGSSFGGGGE
jgi:hypothetical protein